MARAETMLVFDPVLWGGKDVGDNEQFWKPATILWRSLNEDGDVVARVRFHHDGRISHGHFVTAMRSVVSDGGGL
jgi:hypothetical protein